MTERLLCCHLHFKNKEHTNQVNLRRIIVATS